MVCLSPALQKVTGELIRRLREDTSCHDKDYKLPFERGENSPLVLPRIHDTQYRVIYDIIEFTHLTSSSSINLDDWVSLAKEVDVRIVIKNLKFPICIIFLFAGQLRTLRWLRHIARQRHPCFYCFSSHIYAGESYQARYNNRQPVAHH